MKKLIAESKLNATYQVVEKFPYVSLGVTLYITHAKIELGNEYLRVSGNTVASFSLQDKIQAVYLDRYYALKHVNRGDNQQLLCSYLLGEYDAYFHQLYEPYSELFASIFPELFNYHKKMNAPVLQECLATLAEKNDFQGHELLLKLQSANSEPALIDQPQAVRFEF